MEAIGSQRGQPEANNSHRIAFGAVVLGFGLTAMGGIGYEAARDVESATATVWEDINPDTEIEADRQESQEYIAAYQAGSYNLDDASPDFSAMPEISQWAKEKALPTLGLGAGVSVAGAATIGAVVYGAAGAAARLRKTERKTAPEPVRSRTGLAMFESILNTKDPELQEKQEKEVRRDEQIQAVYNSAKKAARWGGGKIKKLAVAAANVARDSANEYRQHAKARREASSELRREADQLASAPHEEFERSALRAPMNAIEPITLD